MFTPNPSHIARVLDTLRERRAAYDRTTIPAHRGEIVREMHSIIRDSLSRYGSEVEAQGKALLP